jgi:hypothetical protein
LELRENLTPYDAAAALAELTEAIMATGDEHITAESARSVRYATSIYRSRDRATTRLWADRWAPPSVID